MLSGVWTHYAITYDNEDLKLYLNGLLFDSIPATGYLNWGDGNDRKFYLGAYGISGWEAKADIDEVRVYNKALNQSEITALYGWVLEMLVFVLYSRE